MKILFKVELYAQSLLIAVPIFLGLIYVEYFISISKGLEVFNGFDTISSLSSGITNSLKDLFKITFVIVSYHFLYAHFHFFEIKSTLLIYLFAFIGLDLAGYWSHRLEHEINLFWNRHIIHHSSEEFNLACALRQNISAIVMWFTIFLVPCAVVGVPPQVLDVLIPIHLFAQFWYHTQLINKMGFLEHIIVTPSHHRVHHAINDIYLDKNYSQIFIIWDKMFGTFQKELPEETPVYGTKVPAATWNPIKINFQHLYQIMNDAWHASSFQDKIKIWFKPTGWRPQELVSSYPISIQKAHEQTKYRTKVGPLKKTWAWLHFGLSLIALLYLLTLIRDQSQLPEVVAYGFLIFISIYANTEFMDGSNEAWIAEIVRIVTALFFYIKFGTFIFAAIVVFGCISLAINYLCLPKANVA